MSDAQLLIAVKSYLRIDFIDDDGLLSGFVAGAKGYLRSAGVKDALQDDPVYLVVIQMLVSLFYENRNVAADKLSIPPVINNFIIQLCAKSQIGGGTQ